jgi:hypothetical protein
MYCWLSIETRDDILFSKETILKKFTVNAGPLHRGFASIYTRTIPGQETIQRIHPRQQEIKSRWIGLAWH